MADSADIKSGQFNKNGDNYQRFGDINSATVLNIDP